MVVVKVLIINDKVDFEEIKMIYSSEISPNRKKDDVT